MISNTVKDGWYVLITEDDTGKIEKMLGPYSKRGAEKVESAMWDRINAFSFSAETKHSKDIVCGFTTAQQ